MSFPFLPARLLCALLPPCALAILAAGVMAQSVMSTATPLRSGSVEALAALTAAVESSNEAEAARALALDLHPGDFPALVNSAAGKKAENIVRLLIDYGADASRAVTALRAAVDHKSPGMTTALLEAGADPNLPDAQGISPLRAALTSGQLDLARLMLHHGAYPDDLLDPAVAAGDTALLSALFECGLSPNRLDASGENLLVRAVNENRPQMIRFLMEKGADAALPGRLGQPALHVAMVANSRESLQALLEAGADPNVTFLTPVKKEFLDRVEGNAFRRWLERDTGLTPLMMAASRGDAELVRLLIAGGAERHQRSKKWKRYPVNFACENEHVPAAQALLLHKLEPGELPHTVVISLSKQRAMLYKGDELVRTSRVSTGRKGYATPKGIYVITDKSRSWVSTIYHVAMPFFMRLSCRDFGMHAGVCPGYPASHGCIRMPHGEVKAFFSILKVGDKVTIED